MIERRSASGVRVSGDDYQYLVAWTEAAFALFGQEPWGTLQLEAAVPTSLDDVVIKDAGGVWRYIQAKYAVDAQRLLNSELIIETESGAARSLLQKLHAGWRAIGERGAVGTIDLVTNRAVDPEDPILRLLDARDDSLRRLVRAPPSRGPIAVALAMWAGHLDVKIDELLEFLSFLRVKAATSLGHLRTIAAAQMTAAGLVSTEEAMRQGVDVMRVLVTQDVGPITPEQLAERIAHMPRMSDQHDALVVVEAIDEDHAAETATHRVDWRESYPQEKVDQRVVPAGGTAAFGGFWDDLRVLHADLDKAGATKILARGTLRMAGWFALGYSMRAVGGFHLTIQRGAVLTRSDTQPSELCLKTETTDLGGGGGGVAVALGVSADPAPAVRGFLDAEGIPVDTLLGLTVSPRPGPAALQDDADAAAVVAAARDAIRPYVGQGRVHLFLACPAGVAAMLGHTWHRLPAVTVYEHIGPGYIKAFEFD